MKPTTNAPVATQTAHTPGPWSVQLGGYCRSVIHRAGHPDQVVANAYGNEETAAANAAIIAAAPELLAALERLANAVDAHCRDITTAALIELDDATINSRAAISKATGGAK
jgi:hypothetical protein